jgi:para-nitrobenzyl esterase
MIGYWSNFVRSGNPNGAGDIPWSRYTRAQPAYLSPETGGPVTIDEHAFVAWHKCEFWATLAPATH